MDAFYVVLLCILSFSLGVISTHWHLTKHNDGSLVIYHDDDEGKHYIQVQFVNHPQEVTKQDTVVLTVKNLHSSDVHDFIETDGTRK